MSTRVDRTPLGPTDAKVLAVCGRFVGYFVLFAAAMSLIGFGGGWTRLRLLTAQASTALITLTGETATLSGTLIRLPNRTLAIDFACTGLMIAAMYCALVLAYPIKPHYRLLGVAIGVPTLLVANLIRIVTVAHVSVSAPGAFAFVHDYLFQVGMVLVAAVLWAAWLSLGRRYAR